VRLVRLPVGPPDSRAQGEVFHGAQLINALVWTGHGIVEVAPMVELGPNMGICFGAGGRGCRNPLCV
jgi:hypothetical protein